MMITPEGRGIEMEVTPWWPIAVDDVIKVV